MQSKAEGTTQAMTFRPALDDAEASRTQSWEPLGFGAARLARRVGPERPHARRAGPGPTAARVAGRP